MRYAKQKFIAKYIQREKRLMMFVKKHAQKIYRLEINLKTISKIKTRQDKNYINFCDSVYDNKKSNIQVFNLVCNNVNISK